MVGLFPHFKKALQLQYLAVVLLRRRLSNIITRNVECANIAVNSMCKIWKERFEENKITEPQESAEYIVAHVLGKKMIHEVPSEMEITQEEFNEINSLCEKRLNHLPVQYVIEEWDFKDLTLKMKPPVFIPRPETEALVDNVYQDIISKKIESPKILEIGCGAGAISLALLKMLPEAKGVAVDQSFDAVQLTTHNAISLNLQSRLKVKHLELNPDTMNDSIFQEQAFDVLVSNPPYIISKDMEQLAPEIKRYEDIKALHGGEDGLNIIRNILCFAPKVLLPNSSVWLEVDSSHPEKIKRLAETQCSKTLLYKRTYKDFNGLQRFCHLLNK